MNRRIVMWGVIGILFLAAIFMTFKVGDISTGVETVKSTGLAAQSATSSYSGMVGGC